MSYKLMRNELQFLYKDEKWRKNKPKGDAKNTFDDAVPFNQRKTKAKFKSKSKNKNKKR